MLLLTSTFFSLFLVGFHVARTGKNLGQIQKHLGNGDVEKLSFYFAQDVLVEYPDFTDSDGIENSKQQLERFFFNHPPKKFVKSHSGKSSGGQSSYMIGKLITANANFRVVVEMKSENITCLMIQTEFRDQDLIGSI